MYIRNLTFLLYLGVFTLSIIGCKDNKNTIEDNLLSMRKKAIFLPLDSMVRLHSKNDTTHFEDRKPTESVYRYVIYIDSTQCSTCSIDGLHRWNRLIDSVRLNKPELSFLFIVSPPKWQLEDVFLAIESSGLKNDIYVDSLSIFSGVNPHLPQDIKYHSFILDMDNNPILVGNVLENPSIRKIFDKILSSKNSMSE